MVDSCYICRRTQTDLDHLNEEVRTRAYLSYFSNARSQIDEQSRKIQFLQRIQDEESGDPHFRINAQQVFGDPEAYQKLMPWIRTLIDISEGHEKRTDDPRTVGELVRELLEQERKITAQMEQGLSDLRSGFAVGEKAPLTLVEVTCSFPVSWSIAGTPFGWKAAQPSDTEPLRRVAQGGKAVVDVRVHLCSVCRKLTSVP